MARPPFGGPSSDVIVPGKVHSDSWQTLLDLCSEDYLAVMQLRLQRGRFLSEEDITGARHVAVINEAFARRYLPDQNPNGQIVKFSVFDRVPSLKDAGFEIIGVVSDAKNQGFNQPTTPQAFLPHTLISNSYKSFVVRTAVQPESLIPQIQQLVWSVDPKIAMINASSIDSFLQKFFYANSEFEFITLSSFAMLGLLLVLIGIFSVMGYTVALQTHEIGIRMALGAARGRIIRTVLGKGTILIAAGLAIGVAGSLLSARYLAQVLRGVPRIDAATFAGVVVLMVLTGLAACFVPARRASRVDPLEAIRCE
jgi:ABC-type antimicrobial peptide transport system permease subunit